MTKCYVEGMAWVLQYYYQGVRSDVNSPLGLTDDNHVIRLPHGSGTIPSISRPSPRTLKISISWTSSSLRASRSSHLSSLWVCSQPRGTYISFSAVQRHPNEDACSRQHIPTTFHDLMTNESSPIIDFYPTTFQIDMNGKRMAWQGVALLPFIEEKRLLEAMGPRYECLTEDEKRRNKWGNDVLFVYEAHALYPTLEALYGKRKKDEVGFSASRIL